MKSSSDLFREFVKDFLDHNLTLPAIKRKWNSTPGLFDALKANIEAFPMFGIRATYSEIDPGLYISLADNDERLKRHDGKGLTTYPVDNIIEI